MAATRAAARPPHQRTAHPFPYVSAMDSDKPTPSKLCANPDSHVRSAVTRPRSTRSERSRVSRTLRLCFPRSREALFDISRSPTSFVARLPTTASGCSPKVGWVMRARRPWPPIGLLPSLPSLVAAVCSLASVVQRPVQARVHPAVQWGGTRDQWGGTHRRVLFRAPHAYRRRAPHRLQFPHQVPRGNRAMATRTARKNLHPIHRWRVIEAVSSNTPAKQLLGRE